MSFRPRSTAKPDPAWRPPSRTSSSGRAKRLPRDGRAGADVPLGRLRSRHGRRAASLDDFVDRGTPTGGYMSTSEFLTFIRNAEAGVKERGMFEGRGPVAILLLVLIGGLALNLTPCVLPMIPINLAIIGAGAQAQSRGRGFLLGSAYGGAMALVYGVLGLIVILTAGTFGTINSSPWFNLGIAILFVVLGAGDVRPVADRLLQYSTRFARQRHSRQRPARVQHGRSCGAAGRRLCRARRDPGGAVLEQPLRHGHVVALALPFCLGIGMAIPWPIAGAGLAALPKPGMWMVRVKQVFGVFILRRRLYYGYEAYALFANRWVDPAAVTLQRAGADQGGLVFVAG